MSLTPRQNRILAELVREFILTADSVSSGVLEKKLGNLCSSATIRNEMVELETKGYLQRLHVSSGRIPTNQAYRYYVDYLMDKEEISLEEQYTIKQEMNKRIYQVDQLLDKALYLIAHLSHQMSILVPPNLQKVSIKDIRLIMLNPYSILIVIVTTTGLVINRVIENPLSISEDDLERISNFLKEKLRDINFGRLESSIVDGEDKLFRSYVQSLIEEIRRAVLLEVKSEVKWLGTRNLLSKPEFKDVDKLRELLDFLEDNRTFIETDNNIIKTGEVSVTIGQEHKYKEMYDCSLITAYYSVAGEVVGKMGILGPTRMHYSRVVPLVSFIASSFTTMLNRINC